MRTTTLHPTNELALLGTEIDELLLQAPGLLLVRDLLATRGASQHELDAHTEELERVRQQLAELICAELL